MKVFGTSEFEPLALKRFALYDNQDTYWFLCIFVDSRHMTGMKKLIFIDACMRAGSRTKRIASPIIEELGKRIGHKFPSTLKVFFENMSLFGITFDTNDKECYGLRKAEKVMYITSRGMNISTGDYLEQATHTSRLLKMALKSVRHSDHGTLQHTFQPDRRHEKGFRSIIRRKSTGGCRTINFPLIYRSL